MTMTENRIPGVPAAGTYTTPQVAEATGIHASTLNRLAVTLGWSQGSGSRLRWSWLDVQALRIAAAIEWAGAGDAFPVIARAVFHAHATGAEPVLSGWVAYVRGDVRVHPDLRRPVVRYGATPSEAIGQDPGAVVAWLRPLTKEHP